MHLSKGAANPPPNTNLIVSRGREIKMIQERKKEEKGGKGREKGGKREGERGREGGFSNARGAAREGRGGRRWKRGPPQASLGKVNQAAPENQVRLRERLGGPLLPWVGLLGNQTVHAVGCIGLLGMCAGYSDWGRSFQGHSGACGTRGVGGEQHVGTSQVLR